MENITTGLGGGLFTIVLLLVIGYLIRIDMADITGIARAKARSAMPALAQQLGYQLIEPRTEQKQGGLEKNFGRYQISVNGDMSRIQVAFSKSTGLRISSLEKNDFSSGELQQLQFANSSLQRFFKLRSARANHDSAVLDESLAPLAEQFDSRAIKYVYIKDEYLRIGFQYRGYLPASAIRDSLPVLEGVAAKIAAIRNK